VYWTAFVVPDFMNYLLAGGALSIVFIPIFGGYLAKGQTDEAWRAFSVIANALLLALGVATVGLWFALPALVPLVAPGFTDAQGAELVALSRIILPAQIFHLVGGLLSACLQAQDRHALPALAPLLYTGSIVAGGLLLGPSIGAYGFAWGVLVGSVLGPFGLPLYGCLRTGLRWSPTLRWDDDLKAYLWRSLPIMLGWSIVVVDDWILRRQGSLVGPGAISTLQYAKTLMKVPMGVFGLATGVAAFPTLTRLLAKGERAQAYQTLATATRQMLVLAFGAQVVLTVAGTEIATVVYGPKLPPEQHAAIGTALALMSLGLWAWAAQTVVARGFYAMGNTWLPTIVGTILVVLAYPVYAALGAAMGTDGLASASPPPPRASLPGWPLPSCYPRPPTSPEESKPACTWVCCSAAPSWAPLR
jgi:putative peptidoglycan lipid II flippase